MLTHWLALFGRSTEEKTRGACLEATYGYMATVLISGRCYLFLFRLFRLLTAIGAMAIWFGVSVITNLRLYDMP
jgi:hypothetical protein